MTKKLYMLYGCWGTIFVDENANLVHYIHENDACFRIEYMNRIANFFGGQVVGLDVELETDDEDYDVEAYIGRYKTQILESIRSEKG